MTEKILQFGTGRFLRAFADCFIDEAISSNRYDGQIVMVASTPSGRLELFNHKNGRYHLWTRGVGPDGLINTLSSVNAVNRVMSANTQWDEVVRLGENPHLEAVISNTTEVGLSLLEPDDLSLPKSFPGRLCALLYGRAKYFDYSPSKGLVVLPCELIEQNGNLLRTLITKQATRWQLGDQFLNWLTHSVIFCNTLVDRIVPGLPEETELENTYLQLGYRDELLTVCEPYRLWAIEGDSELQEKLVFLQNAGGIVVTPDIEPYRIRKVRILNGGHSLFVPIGFLAGCETVLDSMNHPNVRRFVESLLRDEIGPALPVNLDTVPPYIDEVLQRWQNPYMHHRLTDIMMQSTIKLRHRVVPTVVDYYDQHPDGPAPKLISLGFAGWFYSMRGFRNADEVHSHSSSYPFPDDYQEDFNQRWPFDKLLLRKFVDSILSDEDYWGTSLTVFPGFVETVHRYLQTIINDGVAPLLNDT
ncbi:MAG: tagaturonate reductase [Bacteroidetes bacterium]|nr:tagaturonate reductase [Bacteroidota bacterium]